MFCMCVSTLCVHLVQKGIQPSETKTVWLWAAAWVLTPKPWSQKTENTTDAFNASVLTPSLLFPSSKNTNCASPSLELGQSYLRFFSLSYYGRSWKFEKAGSVVHVFDSSTQGGRSKWISEFEPSLVYITNSRIARARGRILVSTKQNKTKQNKTKQNKTKL